MAIIRVVFNGEDHWGGSLQIENMQKPFSIISELFKHKPLDL